MRPLDLKVGLQNSYEASRSEAVRLDKPVIISQLANEDARRDQVHRDQMVTPPPENHLLDDIFERDKQNERDFGDASQKKSQKRQTKDGGPEPETDGGTTGNKAGETESAQSPDEAEGGGGRGGGFSTYA